MTLQGSWQNRETLSSKRYVCGHCGSDITTQIGYKCIQGGHNTIFASIYICHHCNKPTLFYGNQQVPGAQIGGAVLHLPKDLDDMYQEIRNATAANAYTAAVMAGRKLLMHIAVANGDKPGESFQHYVNYLESNHFTPPNSKAWIDRIRQLGNEANHEIVIMGQAEASHIIKFIEMLLKFMYEFPNSVASEGPAENSSDLDPT